MYSPKSIAFGPQMVGGFHKWAAVTVLAPGHNALKNQVVGFLFAAQYMRGAKRRFGTL